MENLQRHEEPTLADHFQDKRTSPDQDGLDMDGLDLLDPIQKSDYTESLHFQINQNLRNQPRMLCMTKYYLDRFPSPTESPSPARARESREPSPSSPAPFSNPP